MAKRDACDVFKNLPTSSQVLDKFPTLLASLFQAKADARELEVDLLGKHCALQQMQGQDGVDDEDDGAIVVTCSNDSGRLPQKASSYVWILRDNQPQDRILRQQSMDLTLAACQRGNFVFDGQLLCFRNIASMCAATEFVSAPSYAPLDPRKLSQHRGPSWFTHAAGSAADVAIECQRRRRQVGLVSAGSAYSVGGGCRRGSRHAMEESLCVRSTLFQSLAAAHALGSSDEEDAKFGRYIPQDSVILSRDVEFFRGSTIEGYPFLPNVECLSAVITVAMPNCNSNVKDAPVDAPRNRTAYTAMLKEKFSAVLAAAVRAQARVLVMPDVGCGAYGNDATDVGSIFGDTLRQGYFHCFDEIHLVGQRAFTDAALERSTLGWSAEPRPRRKVRAVC